MFEEKLLQTTGLFKIIIIAARKDSARTQVHRPTSNSLLMAETTKTRLSLLRIASGGIRENPPEAELTLMETWLTKDLPQTCIRRVAVQG